MSLLRRCLGAVAAVGACSMWAQSNAPATLNDLVIRATQNNRELLAARQRIEEAKGLLRQAGVRPAPTLDVGGVTGRMFGTVGEEQLSAGISREFEMAGKRTKRQDVAEKQVAFAEAEYQERLRQLRYEIGSRYADYNADVARLGVIDRLRESMQRSIDLTRARVEKGDAAALELNLLDAELARADAQRAMAAGRLESTRAEIGRLIGITAGETSSVAPQADLPQLDKESLLKRALEGRSDLSMMRVLEAQGLAETVLVEAEGRANVTLSAGYARVYSRFDDQFGTTSLGQPTQLRDRDDVFSIGVSLPLFVRHRNAGNIEAANARARGARLRREYLERAIPLEIEASWQRLESLRRALAALSQRTLPLAEKNMDVIRQSYQLGQLRMLDVLNEQRRVFETQLAAIDTSADLQRAIAEIERATGAPIQ